VNGGCDHEFLFKAGSRHKTVISEAWRIFCRPGTTLDELYKCRGTSFMASRLQVKVYKVLLKALARSGFIPLQFPVLRAGVNCKKCDKPINFIVRVRCCHVKLIFCKPFVLLLYY
jgi:hypothetical protein